MKGSTKLEFSKWHGTGNDFVIVDDRKEVFPSEDLTRIKELCDRHFGIGSDGLILIQRPIQANTAFHMEFYNPDGSKSFCGNGSRCAFAFWNRLSGSGMADFSAIDGVHQGRMLDGKVSVSLFFTGSVGRDVDGPEVDHLNTGSPHEVVWVVDPVSVDLASVGRSRRYASRYSPGGTNVNFVRVKEGVVEMRTYERGVEAETLSCGTGVVAAALSALERGRVTAPVEVRTPGGALSVNAERSADGTFGSIQLIGPAKEVYTGTIMI
jgi:diaminopimelate epimerase